MGGGGGPGRSEPPETLQSCLDASLAAALSRKQAILAGQASCVSSLSSLAGLRCTTDLVPPVTSISSVTFYQYAGRYCTAVPTPIQGNGRRGEESDAQFQHRLSDSHARCEHDIATSLTADNRSKCVEDLREGDGYYWPKFLLHAGPGGDFGWEVGADHDQGFEKFCAQETTKALLASNSQKVQDDIECRRRFTGH